MDSVEILPPSPGPSPRGRGFNGLLGFRKLPFPHFGGKGPGDGGVFQQGPVNRPFFRSG